MSACNACIALLPPPRCLVLLLLSLQLDEDDYIAAMMTMDPLLIEGLGPDYSLEALKPYLPPYTGMRHPPPKTGSPECDKPWSAPFLANYTGGRGKRMRFTMCNWYLPQGPGVPAIYR